MSENKMTFKELIQEEIDCSFRFENSTEAHDYFDGKILYIFGKTTKYMTAIDIIENADSIVYILGEDKVNHTN